MRAEKPWGTKSCKTSGELERSATALLRVEDTGARPSIASRAHETCQFGLKTPHAQLLSDLAPQTMVEVGMHDNCVYPRLRPGGVYVIENWPMHRVSEMDPPPTLLLFELSLAGSDAPGVVANASVNRDYALVTKGDAELDAGTFDLSQ